VRTVCPDESTSEWVEASFRTLCEPPQRLRLTEAGRNFLGVKWDPLIADRFKISWKIADRSDDFLDSDRIHGANTAYTINHWRDDGGLRECTEYEVRLQSVCQGENSFDERRRFKTECAPCVNPMIRHGFNCGDLFIARGPVTGMDVRWATQTRLPNEWEVQVRECASFQSCGGAFFDLGSFRQRTKDKTCDSVTGTKRHIDYWADTMPALLIDHYYEFRARYRCDNGNWSEWRNEVYIIVPTVAVVQSLTPTSATVRWDPVPNALGYIVSFGLPDEEAPHQIHLGPEVLSTEITGLTTGQPYEIEVYAQIPEGLSLPASLSAVPAASASCAVPADLTASTSATGAVLEWSPAAGALSYRVQFAPLASATWTERTTTEPTTRLAELEPGSAYRFRVQSSCGGSPERISSWSEPLAFTTAAGCDLALSPASASIPSAGVTGNRVEVSAGCAWSAAATVPWITLVSGASGAGDGAVVYDVGANPSSNPRSGALSIGGQTVAVDQAGSSCTYSIAPSSRPSGADGGRDTVAVTAPAGCPWSAASQVPWIEVTTGASGGGSGTVGYRVAANAGPARTGTVGIAGRTFTVSQAARPCSYVVEPLSIIAPAGGVQGEVITISARPECAWNAASHNSWITLRSAPVGAGAGVILFDVAANSSGQVRAGSLTVAGQPIPVYQEACTVRLQPTARDFSYTSDSDSIAVSVTGGCAWTAVSAAPWITVTSGSSGTGSGTVSYSVATNTATTWPTGRSGSIVIGGQAFTVTQSGQPSCPNSSGLSCDTLGLSSCFDGCFVQSGGTKTVYTWLSRTDCDWTPRTTDPWIEITNVTDTGANPRSFTYRVDPNFGADTRVGGIYTNGLLHRVTQGGSSDAVSGRVTDLAGQGIGGVTITFGSFLPYAPPGLPAAVVTDGSGFWSQSGFQVCRSSFAEASRAGHTFIPNRRGFSPGAGDADFTVEGCTAATTVFPTTFSLPGGASGPYAVQVGTTCAWTVQNRAPWIMLTSGASGVGSGNVTFSADPNPGPTTRAGTLIVAGQLVVVQQEGLACATSLSPTAQSFPTGGGAGSLVVNASDVCQWSAASDVPWISITSGAGGSGSGAVSFQVAANSGTGRIGTLTVAGHTFTVEQAGTVQCTYGLSPAGASWSAAGGSGSVTIDTPIGCAWTAASSVPWISVASGGSGANSGGGAAVSYSVAANTSSTSRSGSLTIAGQTFNVSQAGVSTPPGAPSTLTATVLSWSTVKLTWKDNSTNESGFIVERKTGSGAFAAAATTAAGATTYNDATLAGNTTYTFRIRATNAAGASSATNEVTVTTPKP
jgi:hypothetical protein